MVAMVEGLTRPSLKYNKPPFPNFTVIPSFQRIRLRLPAAYSALFPHWQRKQFCIPIPFKSFANK
eukprot:4101177-Amphidinium_carterae.1